MSKFKIGDPVRFIGGGPLMIITGPSDYNNSNIACTWFDKNHDLHQHIFEVQFLVDVIEKDLLEII